MTTDPSVPLRLGAGQWLSLLRLVDDAYDHPGPMSGIAQTRDVEAITELNRQFRDWQEQNRKETPCKTTGTR